MKYSIFVTGMFLFRNPPQEPNARLPESTHAERQKNKQIEWLKDELPGVVEIKRDEHYRLPCTVREKSVVLDIYLSPRFPLEGPSLKVTPTVNHPWVEQQTVTPACPALRNYSVHSNLGKVVKAVIKDLNETPPDVSPDTVMSASVPAGGAGFTPYGYGSVPMSISATKPRRKPPSPPGPSGTTHYQLPPLPNTFGHVHNLSAEELSKYLGEEEGAVLIDQLILQQDVFKKVWSDKEEKFKENHAQALINKEHEPELDEAWLRLQQSHMELSALLDRYNTLTGEHKRLTDRYSPRRVESTLRALVQESDTTSELIAEDWLENKMSVTDFIQKFKEIRKLHHLRQAKYEKLTHPNNPNNTVPPPR